MKFFVIAATLALAAALYVGVHEFSVGRPRPPQASAADVPIVVELFTSQGCSSCPPADRLLSALGSDPELTDRIIPLAFHVDYWDYIGWTDPFSSKAWTERQYEYSRALGAGVYTPQAVVNGQIQVIGSDENGVRDAIGRARTADPAAVTIQIDPPGADSVTMTVHVERAIGNRHAGVFVVLFENGVETEVRRGENSGRRLHNDYIVRRFLAAGALVPGERSRDLRVSVPASTEWSREHLGVAALVQDPATMMIYGAAVARSLP